MNTTATENFVIDRFAAAELLAGRDGRRILLTDISWNNYENFLEDFESLDKFPIYAALNVPELWIFDGKKLAFYELADKNYHQIQNSRALPKISAQDLVKFLEISRSKGQTAALKSFRQ